MAKAFRPTVNTGSGTIQYPTYTKLKSNLKRLLEENSNGVITVYRHRRGEWGEWFEQWRLNYKRRPTIIKSGWM